MLLFDEPVNGLDPEGICWIRALLRSLAGGGRAVLVSSHLMHELEGTADHLLVIGRGRLIADTSVSDLLAAASANRISIRTPTPWQVMTLLAGAGATVASTGQDTLTVIGLPALRIADLIAERGLRLHELTPQHLSLEEAYMERTKDAVDYQAHSSTDQDMKR